MRVLIPYLNPVRFYRDGGGIDYDTYYPAFDLMRLNTKYQRGIYPVNNKVDVVTGKEMTYQVTVVQPLSSFRVQVFFNGSEIPQASIVNVTPAGWTTTQTIIQWSYTPAEDGEYYFFLSIVGSGIYVIDRWYYSDTFRATSNLDDKKGLVKINYYDERNRYGGVFFDNTTQIWSPIAYFTGQITPDDPSDDQSVYDNEKALVLLESNPKRTAVLTLTEINVLYIDVIKQQSVCDNYYVNGIKYNVSDFKVDKIDKSDICTITMKLTQQENEYFFMYQ